ncbi:hypothetical protein HMPREF9123_0985 [Neisseria bacilliformis ATCC BAA-1200]|uniref:Uncharacterized protein n=1 Tax=Neisseria bacilliformis ATCC BAA-1200 TaxID=888742 RepID=F2BB81_9NEIS|nr:hypothetical protein HMPREF9123_0985 [Neisseria bacilliformis ATCC BAA-1200]
MGRVCGATTHAVFRRPQWQRTRASPWGDTPCFIICIAGETPASYPPYRPHPSASLAGTANGIRFSHAVCLKKRPSVLLSNKKYFLSITCTYI